MQTVRLLIDRQAPLKGLMFDGISWPYQELPAVGDWVDIAPIINLKDHGYWRCKVKSVDWSQDIPTILLFSQE